MKRKKLLMGLAVVVALGVALALALPALIDVNAYRDPIQARASAALGREVRLGEMKLSWLPVFGVRVDDVAVAALPEEGGGDLITARSLRVGARLLPLLKGRLEATSIVVDAPRLTLVREEDGRWNLEKLLASGESEPTGAGSAGFEVDRLRLTGGEIAVHDRASGGGSGLELTLTDLDLTLDDFAPDRPLTFTLETGWREAPGARLSLGGRIGPFPAAEASESAIPVDVKVRATGIPLSRLEGWLRSDLPADDGEAGVDLTVAGSMPDRLDIKGEISLGGGRLRVTDARGETRSIPLDAKAWLDVEATGGGERLNLRDLKLSSGGHDLAIRGTIEQRGPIPVADLEILPTSIPADELATLLTLVSGELPVAFGSKTPVELQGRVRGPLGGDTLPEIEGSARLRDFVFRHPSMSQPIEQVRADVSLKGRRVEIRDLSGVVGSSDIGGRVDLEGFEAPQVRFDLVSKHADFGELFSFLDGESSTGAAAGGEDPLAGLHLDGILKIERGSFGTLDFESLGATLRWRDGVVTLDPVDVALYQGTFRGKVGGDLGQDVPRWSVAGEAAGVDVAAFLADNAGVENLISGRFSGRVDTKTEGADYESIVRGLTGGGGLEIDEGRVGRLDVLKVLSRVSGVFGESSLKHLSGQLATEGTEFSVLSSRVGLAQGRMRLDEILLDSPSFRLTGNGLADLLANRFAGDFLLALSPEISAAMHQEKSKAAEIFWNSRTSRVEMPFSLSGPFDAPTPSVDFKAAASESVKRRLEDRVRSELGAKLGLEEPDQAAPAAPAAPTGPTDPIAITETRWSGSLLARDLRIAGVVRASGIAGVSVEVTDAKGRTVERIERLPEIEAAVAEGGDASAERTVAWKVKVDGKKLALARMPVEVVAVLTLADGTTHRAMASVDR